MADTTSPHREASWLLNPESRSNPDLTGQDLEVNCLLTDLKGSCSFHKRSWLFWLLGGAVTCHAFVFGLWIIAVVVVSDKNIGPEFRNSMIGFPMILFPIVMALPHLVFRCTCCRPCCPLPRRKSKKSYVAIILCAVSALVQLGFIMLLILGNAGEAGFVKDAYTVLVPCLLCAVAAFALTLATAYWYYANKEELYTDEEEHPNPSCSNPCHPHTLYSLAGVTLGFSIVMVPLFITATAVSIGGWTPLSLIGGLFLGINLGLLVWAVLAPFGCRKDIDPQQVRITGLWCIALAAVAQIALLIFFSISVDIYIGISEFDHAYIAPCIAMLCVTIPLTFGTVGYFYNIKVDSIVIGDIQSNI